MKKSLLFASILTSLTMFLACGDEADLEETCPWPKDRIEITPVPPLDLNN